MAHVTDVHCPGVLWTLPPETDNLDNATTKPRRGARKLKMSRRQAGTSAKVLRILRVTSRDKTTTPDRLVLTLNHRPLGKWFFDLPGKLDQLIEYARAEYGRLSPAVSA